MIADVFTSNLYWNTNLGKFFLSSQAIEQLERLVKLAKDPEELFDKLDENFNYVDDLCDFLHEEKESKIIEIIGKEYFNIEDYEEL